MIRRKIYMKVRGDSVAPSIFHFLLPPFPRGEGWELWRPWKKQINLRSCKKCKNGKVVANDSESCNDSDPCTENDHCSGGACIGNPVMSPVVPCN